MLTKGWSYPGTSGSKLGRDSQAKPPKQDVPPVLEMSSASILSSFFPSKWNINKKKKVAFPNLKIDKDSVKNCEKKKNLICYGIVVLFFFLLFENTQPSGQQTSKMLNDIGSKISTEKQ